jgi:hypothetical protein
MPDRAQPCRPGDFYAGTIDIAKTGALPRLIAIPPISGDRIVAKSVSAVYQEQQSCVPITLPENRA